MTRFAVRIVACFAHDHAFQMVTRANGRIVELKVIPA